MTVRIQKLIHIHNYLQRQDADGRGQPKDKKIEKPCLGEAFDGAVILPKIHVAETSHA